MKQLFRFVSVLFCIALSLNASSQCPVNLTSTSTNVTCFQGTTGSITASASGGTAPYQYQLAEAGAGAWASNNVFTGLAAGTYPVSARDATGCIKTIYVTITQPAALTVTYTAINPVCSGANNGSISTQTSGGVAPYTYSWTRNGSAYSTSANISSLSPGNYLLVATDASGCTTSPVITQQVRPVTLTGYNEDVVANGTGSGPTNSTSRAIDQSPGYVYYAAGYTNASSSAGANGLPASGAFNSAQDAGRGYQLASYSSNNVLLLRSSTDASNGGTTSGSLSFTAPYQAPYATLYVVGTTGSGTGTINYQVNYSDATTTTGTLNFPDWFLASSTSSSIRALGSLDRVSRDATGTYGTGQSFNLFEAPISIPGASQSKNISSVTFTWSGSGSARTSLFAITGYTSTTSGIRINEGPSSSVSPSVSIVSNTSGNLFCSGQSVTFTATPVNGGTSPSYQWRLNGSNVGTNSATYTTTGLSNNGQVSVILTAAGSVSCLSTSTATSNTILMTLATKTASVTTSASSTTVCTGTTVTFTANPANGGTSPSYQWKLNGANVGSNSATYTNSSLNHNDQVSVVMTSNISCATGNPATSSTVTMIVNPVVSPTATITATKVTPGLQFSSTINNGGSTPQYQWYRNGTAISSANGTTLSAPTAAIGETYSLRVTSSNACATPPAIMSNYINVTAATLPLTLEWFRVKEEGGAVKLSWKTSFEDNLLSYEIQRSDDPGAPFTTIAEIEPKNILTGAHYTYNDESVEGGTYYYRLQHRDRDGKVTIDGTVTVRLNNNVNIRIATKASSWQVYTTGVTTYGLLDAYGRTIQKGQANGNFEVAKPRAKGIYYLQLQKNKNSFTYKVIN